MVHRITVFFPPAENRTRAPLELGYRPAASTRIPALACSWLYFTIAAIDSSLGILPASESLLDFRISMNFIVISPEGVSAASGIQFPASLLRRTANAEIDIHGRIPARNSSSALICCKCEGLWRAT